MFCVFTCTSVYACQPLVWPRPACRRLHCLKWVTCCGPSLAGDEVRHPAYGSSRAPLATRTLMATTLYAVGQARHLGFAQRLGVLPTCSHVEHIKACLGAIVYLILSAHDPLLPPPTLACAVRCLFASEPAAQFHLQRRMDACKMPCSWTCIWRVIVRSRACVIIAPFVYNVNT